MRQLQADLQRSLSAETATLCSCWIVKRADGTALGFTDHDRPLLLKGVRCEPEQGVGATLLSQQSGFGVSDAEVEGVLNSRSLRDNDLKSGLYDDARIEMWLVNWAAPDQALRRFVGTIGAIRYDEHVFRADIYSRARELNEPRGRLYTRQCDAVLGDKRCGLDLQTQEWTGSGEVVAVLNRARYRISGCEAYADKWFDLGMLRSGEPEQTFPPVRITETERQDNMLIVCLAHAIRPALKTGDAVTLQVGCDKLSQSCAEKFNNLLNFRGFPHIPGNDFSLGYARKGGANNGAALK